LVYYHHPDRLGTRLITNNANNNTIEQTTLPFGTLIPGAPVRPVNPIFTTYERSTVTGVDHAVHRYYDLGRFTQVDPAGMSFADLTNPQSLNLYNYARNDPVNIMDPTGLDSVMVCDSGSFIDDHTFVQDCWLYETDSFPNDPASDPAGGIGDVTSGGISSGGGSGNFPAFMSSYLGFSGPTVPKTTARPLTSLERLFLSVGGVELLPLASFATLSLSGGAVLTVSGADVETGWATFATEDLLAQHVAKHAAEFGYQSTEEYLAGANRLITNPDVATFVRGSGNLIAKGSGDTLYYDAITNEFAVVNPAGYFRTYFTPSQLSGFGYWLSQVAQTASGTF
jgi:RHS repeat-associated protein